jgi:hypothetical protein
MSNTDTESDASKIGRRIAFYSIGSWGTWKRKSFQFKKSAEVLWGLYETEHALIHALGDERMNEDMDQGHAVIALMLMGFALETFLRACW